ncbi:hypothetical protein [Jiangella asiatica]|uniref:LapA family protein n=1 Tax=Jiangella asiatica TaxID=2530372 RepID=A0A4R5D6K6_9ACTN|nr:hypothetical protein [Jiangella asiatica]TDE07480.1 hypothetical protein E1269_19800 [Jiangella asiatica]
MIVLGLLLLAVAAAAVVVAVIEGGDQVAVSAFDIDLDTPLWGVFAVGIGTGMLGMLGLLACIAGVRRSRERREEIEYLRRKVAAHERAAERDEGDTTRVDRPDRGEGDDVGTWLGQAHSRSRIGAPPQEAQPLYRTPQG